MALPDYAARRKNLQLHSLLVVLICTEVLSANCARLLLDPAQVIPFAVTVVGVPTVPSVKAGYQTTITGILTNVGNRTGNPGQAALLGLAYPGPDPKIPFFAWALSHPVSTDPQLTVGHSGFGVLYPNYTGQLAPGGSVSFTFVLTAFRADTPSDVQFLSGSSLNGPNFQVTLPLVTSPDPGVCGSGPAQYFPNKCVFNGDPQGSYVCCDNQGCNTFTPFKPDDYIFPNCNNAGFIPDKYGVTAPPPVTPPPVTPPPVTPPPATPPPKTTPVPASTPCPAANGVPTNSCFNRNGTTHVCCVNPDSCGGYTPNGDPICANGQYFVFS